MMDSAMAEPSFVIRSANQCGTRPPCNGRSAVPDLFIPPNDKQFRRQVWTLKCGRIYLEFKREESALWLPTKSRRKRRMHGFWPVNRLFLWMRAIRRHG